jgi:hypothetical protein
MPYVHYLMHCQTPKCKPIQLPPPKSHDMQPSQAGLPTGDWKKFFLCLECKHLYEYSGKDIQKEIQDTQSPWELGECLCWSIRYKCDEGNCGTPIEAFAVSDGSATPQTILDTFGSRPSVPRQCPHGHWAQVPQHPKEFDVIHCSFPY